jgi:hypothetical protein
MHKIESFALSTGSKISKPLMEKSFYPLVDRKFICISQNSNSNSKSYDYFNDVIFHVKPYLEKEGIGILELGNSDLSPVFYCKNYRHLNRLQSHYVMSKSLLYIGNDNFYSNIASHTNKDIICPSNKDYVNTFAPYWSNESNRSIIMPDTDNLPSSQTAESPKTINSISPEDLSVEILNKLNIENDLGSIKTIYIGDLYLNTLIDLIPGPYSPANMKGQKNVNIRMDKSFDLNFLLKCSSLQDLAIITDQPIPSEILNKLKPNIGQISFLINNKTTLEEIRSIESAGKPVTLLAQDKRNLNKIRLKFIDYPVILYEKKTKKDLKTKVFSDLTFLSKRNVIHNGQAYNSYLSAYMGKNVSTVKDEKDFWEDLPYCRIFRKSP